MVGRRSDCFGTVMDSFSLSLAYRSKGFQLYYKVFPMESYIPLSC